MGENGGNAGERSEKDKDFLIKELLERGFTYVEIQDLLHVSPRRISAVSRGEFQNHQRGRPVIYGKGIIDFIEVNTLLNAKLTDAQMMEMVNERFGVKMCRATVANIRKRLNFDWRPPLSVPVLTPEQKQDRFQFATEILRILTADTVIIFTDESRFCNSPDNSWRHIRRGEWNSTAYAERAKYTNGVMFWGAIARDFKSELLRCPARMNADGYMEMLQNGKVFEVLDAKYGKHKYVFMQDGAPCHTSQKTMTWLGPKTKILAGWPANSPDLNPIEVVWAILKKKMATRQLSNIASIAEAAIQTWNDLEIGCINGLCEDFERRLRLVVAIGGASISAYISSHINTALRGTVNLMPIDLFSQTEDTTLLLLYRMLGRKWTEIAARLNNGRTSHQVEFRIQTLLLVQQNQQHDLALAQQEDAISRA